MLDHLDDKSEWRKKLLELAGKHPIDTTDIHKLRAFVRFDKNVKSDKNDKYHINHNEKLTPFQNITDAIIGYREYLYDLNILNNNTDDKAETKKTIIRKAGRNDSHICKIFIGQSLGSITTYSSRKI